MTRKNRNITADFLKGLMIICVMYGHSISMLNELRNVSWQDSIVNVFVTTFEMPLFILISGYYLWFSLRKKSHFQVLTKRIIAIGIPLLIWEGIPQVCKFIIRTTSGGAVVNILKIGAGIVFPRLWFLACYLFCTVIVILADRLLSSIKTKEVRIASTIVVYTGLIIGLHFVPFYFDHVPFLFPFFLTGFILSKYRLLSYPAVRKMILILSGIFIILYPFYKPENSFYILGTYIASAPLKLLPIFVHRFVLGLSGCCVFYVIADYLCKRKENSAAVLFVADLGTKTMELYILSMSVQTILIKIVGAFIRDTSIITDVTAPLIWGPVFLVTMTGICLFANGVINKNAKLHKIIFGR